MKLLLNSSNLSLIFTLILFLSCDETTNDNSCPGSQVRDNCGICRLPNDEEFDSCYDACGIQNGLSDCSDYGKCMGLCECLGCGEAGDEFYDSDAPVTSQCACDNTSLLSTYTITDLNSNHQINFSFIEIGSYTNQLTIINNNNENLRITCLELDIEDFNLTINSSLYISNQDFDSSDIQPVYTINIYNGGEEFVSSINIFTSVYPNTDYFESIVESCHECNCSEGDNICCDSEFQCTDGSCIDDSKVCDDIYDCSNGHDEFGCE